ncbi:class I adenylate-forming enzyme family protein [Streptomyces massasporeus]|uniref:class I adenylate-forming enzyme family protein n=1 Tax=Streptomyces massasporeus TaxID=67324 RepID=UPI0036FAA903
MPLAHHISAACRDRPDVTAVWLEGHGITYRDLGRRAAQVARGVRELPVKRRELPGIEGTGRLVAVLTRNVPTFPEILVGATAGDSACALLDPTWSQHQVADVLRRLDPDLLFVDEDHTAAADAAAERRIPVVVIGAGPATAGGYESWLGRHADADPSGDLPAGRDGSAFFIGFTSGTTSTPKAFAMARGCWRTSLRRGAKMFDVDTSERSAAPGPLQHGLTLYAMAEALDAGGTFFGASRFDAEAFAEMIRQHRIERISVVPSMLHGLCRTATPNDVRLDSVTTVITSGARLDGHLLERAGNVFRNARFIDYYGASETGFMTVSEHPRGGRAAGVGLPFPGVEIEVRGADGSICEAGETGEVFVRSPYLSLGYLWSSAGEELRREGGWASVGDHGHLDAEGRLHVRGRKGGMVITGGMNVFPGEVESVLRQLPGVDDAVVTSVEDDYLGSALVAVLGCADTSSAPTLSAVVTSCRTALSTYKVPARFYVVSALPKTSSGKVTRAEVDRWIARGSAETEPLAQLREPRR